MIDIRVGDHVEAWGDRYVVAWVARGRVYVFDVPRRAQVTERVDYQDIARTEEVPTLMRVPTTVVEAVHRPVTQCVYRQEAE